MESNEKTEKKPIYKKWWFWLIIIVIILIVGIGGSEDKSTQTYSNTSSVVSTVSQNQKNEYNQGEEDILGNGAITITNVEKSQGSEYDKPATGKEFVIVHVKIENKGNDKLSYNPYYFKMQNSQGQQENTTFTTVDQDTALKSGELIAGGKVEGTLVFEETKGDTGLVLIYNDNMWSSKELKINLK